MKNNFTLLFLLFFAFLVSNALQAADKIKVLIVDGPQKFHENKKTTPLMKDILEQFPQFTEQLHFTKLSPTYDEAKKAFPRIRKS